MNRTDTIDQIREAREEVRKIFSSVIGEENVKACALTHSSHDHKIEPGETKIAELSQDETEFFKLLACTTERNLGNSVQSLMLYEIFWGVIRNRYPEVGEANLGIREGRYLVVINDGLGTPFPAGEATA